jgi:hypothetical protein
VALEADIGAVLRENHQVLVARGVMGYPGHGLPGTVFNAPFRWTYAGQCLNGTVFRQGHRFYAVKTLIAFIGVRRRAVIAQFAHGIVGDHIIIIDWIVFVPGLLLVAWGSSDGET